MVYFCIYALISFAMANPEAWRAAQSQGAISLSEQNFNSLIKSNPQVAVLFCTQKSALCQKWRAKYNSFAQKIGRISYGFPMAIVNLDQNPRLAQKFGADQYSIVSVFLNGVPSNYDPETIFSWFDDYIKGDAGVNTAANSSQQNFAAQSQQNQQNNKRKQNNNQAVFANQNNFEGDAFAQTPTANQNGQAAVGRNAGRRNRKRRSRERKRAARAATNGQVVAVDENENFDDQNFNNQPAKGHRSAGNNKQQSLNIKSFDGIGDDQDQLAEYGLNDGFDNNGAQNDFGANEQQYDPEAFVTSTQGRKNLQAVQKQRRVKLL